MSCETSSVGISGRVREAEVRPGQDVQKSPIARPRSPHLVGVKPMSAIDRSGPAGPDYRRVDATHTATRSNFEARLALVSGLASSAARQ